MKKIKRLSVAQKAYIAGILDGEGSVGLSRKTDRSMRGGYCYRPLVSVSNTNLALLTWLHRVTGLGKVHKHFPGRGNYKAAWSWHLWSQHAGQLLRAVLPHLRVKKVRASILVAYVKMASLNRVGRNGLSYSQLSYQRRTYLRLQRLNKRGVL